MFLYAPACLNSPPHGMQAAPPPPPALLPLQVLRVRASISTRLSPRASCDLALTGDHVGTILAALARLAAIWPCAVLT